MGAKRPKGERRGIFFLLLKKSFEKDLGGGCARTFFVFEVGESVRGFWKRERRNFMNKESCKLVEAKLQTIYYTHTYTRGRERARARENLCAASKCEARSTVQARRKSWNLGI
uniref:(northern house mosquito) hypothetical protein n=1 Tax=Culex pipiens TaxID=7175 RepID=A0A8D8FUQ2_CULPI